MCLELTKVFGTIPSPVDHIIRKKTLTEAWLCPQAGLNVLRGWLWLQTLGLLLAQLVISNVCSGRLHHGVRSYIPSYFPPYISSYLTSYITSYITSCVNSYVTSYLTSYLTFSVTSCLTSNLASFLLSPTSDP
ncbi:unnamed protein product [Gadus morhua 'NCC']